MSSTDRDVRIKASNAYYNFFKENEEQFDDIFDQLVKIRTTIAKKLNFDNFVELGYIRMMRTDYNAEMVKNFRSQVLKYIVPVASKLYKRQEERLGLDKLTYVDEGFEFLSGNATPKGSSEYIMECGKKMYSELSKETKEFFDFMMENELMDLVTKKGKAAGGYCTYIPNYKSPFIFSNFNQTSDDIDVLTHEAGHAFQLYMSTWIDMPEINIPTFESCEIHSMSMEFITWPWMDLFFKEDTEKYKFIHLGSAIKFIPYGIVVDEFQHYIYENPNMTKEERKNTWRELEKKYLPHKNYEGCDFLEKGTWWFKQGHIFKNPFYYIDYTLAQICSLQFWKKIREDKENGWNDYLNICKVGGTKSFLEIVKIGNLISPFEDGCVESVIGTIENWIDKEEFTVWSHAFVNSEHGQGSADDLYDLADKAMKSEKVRTKLYLAVGTGDFLYEGNCKYHEYLEKIGYEHVFSTGEGIHNFDFWDPQIRKAIHEWLPLQSAGRVAGL